MASGSITRSKYDVFMSFRGEDMRNSFVNHLYAALNGSRINAFRDCELVHSNDIKSSLQAAIKESKFSIVILSKNYASSAGCLDELEYILECRRTLGHTVFPIYYHVDPSDVQDQTRSVEVAFESLKNKFKDDMIKVTRWMVALREVASLAGYHLQNHGHDESTIIGEVVKFISKKLCQDLSVADYPFNLSDRAEEVISMASGSITRSTYDVFLNFRGEDMRNSFVDHLYAALDRVGINTFRDYELVRGNDIQSSLRAAIEESRFSIVVLSKNYASSAWCLDELEYILECRRTLGQIVFPIFYYVHPSDVRHQTRSSEVAFESLRNKFKDDMIKVTRWMVALREVASLAGYHLQNHGHDESTIIGEVVKFISKRLCQDLRVESHQTGLSDRAIEVISMLFDESLAGCIVGIYGVGGIGKTTIAKVVYNLISHKFEGSCFLANIRENSDPKGMLQLQRQLLSRISMAKGIAIYNVDMGLKVIEESLCRKRVLLVLDDVDELNQLNHILGDYSWLRSGSRLLITTRIKDLLKTSPLYKQYEVQKLNHHQSLELFSRHAFDMVPPREDYMELAERVIRFCDGVPLALTCLASTLSGRHINEWSTTLEKLKVCQENHHAFLSFKEVTAALREAGLKSPNLIFGIDFSESNEWAGKMSFNHSLHTVGDTPNPYEQVISIIGKTLAPFHDDNAIPCFGFGFCDTTTRDEKVFSFQSNFSPCHGYQELLATYRDIVPDMRLAGPTSYAPVIEAAIDIVESNGGQYHVLVIITNGEFIRYEKNTNNEGLSPQEEKTIRSIVTARTYPLSIVLVGVGDGLTKDTTKLISKIPVGTVGTIDNFQFAVFTDKDASASEKEAKFAFAALEGIPLQYKAANELGIIGRVMGRAKGAVVCPPVRRLCPVCWTNGMDMVIGCGHVFCSECASRLQNCPLCRHPIDVRIRMLN